MPYITHTSHNRYLLMTVSHIQHTQTHTHYITLFNLRIFCIMLNEINE